MAKRILVTGSAGFVAGHFMDYLAQRNEPFDVYGIDMINPLYMDRFEAERINFKQEIMDLMDGSRLSRAIAKFQPDYVLHLAALSSVAYSWKHPEETFLNNSTVFMNLIRAIRDLGHPCRVLSVGSSEEYGSVADENLPVAETQPLQPGSPYAVARVTQEQLSKMYVDEFGMDIVMTRSFNHIGPRQDKRFVVPSFVDRIRKIKENGNKSGEIETGNIDIIRDFVDVRDVVRAYYMLLEKGEKGEVYNICSGREVKLRDLIQLIAEEYGVEVTTRVNPDYVRPNDILRIVGDPGKINRVLGWSASTELRKTIQDMK